MDEFDLISDALGAVRQIRRHFASAGNGVERIDEVAEMLRAATKTLAGHEPIGLALAVADAIQQSYGKGQVGNSSPMSLGRNELLDGIKKLL